MQRRDFLKQGTLWLAGGLVVGDAALALAAQLAWQPRRLWMGWDGPQTSAVSLQELYVRTMDSIRAGLQASPHELLWSTGQSMMSATDHVAMLDYEHSNWPI